MNNIAALKRTISHTSVGSPLTRGGLTLFPIYVHGPSTSIATGPESGVEIREKAMATVPTLEVVNPTDRRVLLVDGEVVRGGLQTRVLNVSVLVEANQQLDIPVSCVEQGRWSGGSRFSQGAKFATPTVRRTKNTTVFRDVLERGGKCTDQGQVWRAVDTELSRLSAWTASGSLAAAESLLHSESPLADVAREWKGTSPLPEQRGVLVAHGSHIVGAEVFASTDMLAAHWDALVGALVLDAPLKVATRPSATKALRFLSRLTDANGAVAPGVGLGSEFHVSNRHMVAQALVLDDVVVHASAFALAA